MLYAIKPKIQYKTENAVNLFSCDNGVTWNAVTTISNAMLPAPVIYTDSKGNQYQYHPATVSECAVARVVEADTMPAVAATEEVHALSLVVPANGSNGDGGQFVEGVDNTVLIGGAIGMVLLLFLLSGRR